MGKDLETVQGGHKEGITGVCFTSIEGTPHLLSCGSDGNVCVRNAQRLSEVTSSFAVGKALYSIAAHKDGNQFVTITEDQYVKVYNLPDGDFDSIATRGSLPMQTAVYSRCGRFIAAGGDDEGVKLVEVCSYKVLKVLRGASYVRSLAYDPEGSFLAAVTADGDLVVWDILSGAKLLSLKKAAPKADLAGPARSGAAFHPDGGALLAVPGDSHDVVVYERLSWEPSFQLAGQHTAPVNLVSFSPNGLYAVTAGHDKQLVLWDILQRKALATQQTGAVVCGVAWHPSDNCLAAADEAGGLSMWRGLVPDQLPGPAEVVDGEAPAAAASGHLSGAADQEMLDGLGLEGVSEGGAHGGQVMMMTASGTLGGGDLPDLSEQGGAPPSPQERGAAARRQGSGRAAVRYVEARLPRVQDPIHPGSTLEDSKGRRFLAYNLDGCISARSDGNDCQVIEVSFHDTTKQRRRVPLFKDFFGICMADLGEKGALYASPSSAHSPSTVLYRPFEAWAPDSDWTVQLPHGEQALALAAARTFCCVATSARLLRLFSPAGLQSHVLSLAGPAVALAAHQHRLAVVTAGAVRSGSEVALEYAVYDISAEQLLHSGTLPMTAGSSLAWLGFTSGSLLAAQDSTGTLRVRSGQFGGSWVPVFAAETERTGSEVFWLTGVTDSELFCVVCPESAPQPSVAPRPVLTVLPLRVPVLEGDLQAGELESDVMRASAALHQAQSVAVEGGSGHLGPGALARAEDEVMARETDLDRSLLKLFHAALKGGREARALEVASQLHLYRSLEGALKLANHHHKRALAERIVQLVQNRMVLDAEMQEREQQETPVAAAHPEEQAEQVVAQDDGTTEDAQLSTSPAAAADKKQPVPLQLKAPANGTDRQFAATKATLKPLGGSNSRSSAAAAKRPVSGNSSNPFAKKTKL